MAFKTEAADEISSLPTAGEGWSKPDRPNFHPEEGAPDNRSEWIGLLKGALIALLVIAGLAYLLS